MQSYDNCVVGWYDWAGIGMKKKKLVTSEKHLQKMLADAVIDCYGEDEEFSGVLTTLEDNLPFPFEARVIGETVQVIGIDGERSDLRRGIIARVRKGSKEYSVALSELELPQNFKGLKWMEMYEYWVRGFA